MLDNAPSVAFVSIALFFLAAHRTLRRRLAVPLSASLAGVAVPMVLASLAAPHGEAAEGLALVLMGLVVELTIAVRSGRRSVRQPSFAGA